MARTLESKGVVIAGVAVIALCAAVNLWLWFCPPFGATADAGSSTEAAQSADAGSVSRSSSGSDADGTGTQADAAGDGDGDAGTEASAGENADGTDVPNGETETDYVEGLSADASTATDPTAQLDASTVPVPSGIDAEAFRAAVTEYANAAGIGCIRDLSFSDDETRSANGYTWWDLEGTIGTGFTDTYLRVYLEPSGAFSVVRR